MSNVAYSLLQEIKLPVVMETLPDEACRPEPRVVNWPQGDLERVRKILRRLAELRVRNAADAEDLVQDTLLTMLAKSPADPLQKGLLVWGMAILRRKVGNYYRKMQRRAATNVSAATSRTGVPTPESTLHHKELLRLVERTLVDFPAEESRIVALVLEGLAIQEVVELLQSEKYQTVVNRAHRGRRKLAWHLSRSGYSAARGFKV